MCITYPRGHNLSRYAQAEGMAENVGTGQAPHATIAKDTGGTAACPKSRMQFDWMMIQLSLKTLQFQRCDFKF